MRSETRVGIFIVVAISVFFYLSLNIGAFRLDGSSYFNYKVFFEDTGGLERKSPVKIAGVSVGWVESINLLDNGRAEINIKVHREHKLYRNAYATISQDGLIGSRTLEVTPGDSRNGAGLLSPGGTLAIAGRSAATVTDIMEGLREITDSVQDVVSSVKSVFSSPEGEKKMHAALDSATMAAEKMSEFATTLDSVADRNEKPIDHILDNLKCASESFSEGVPEIKNKVVSATEEINQGAKHMKGTFKATENVAQRVERGEGTVGKLITDDSLYIDVKDAVGGIRDFVGKGSNLGIKVDMHSETFYRNDNQRGLAEVKLFMHDDYFYALQVSSDTYGRFTRKNVYREFYGADGNLLDTTDDSLSIADRGRLAYRVQEITQYENDILFGFQFAKMFGDLTLRVGIFENTAGVGVEYKLPIKLDKVSLSTAVEAFDFSGYNRLNDDRVHVRWSNKLFFMNNVYTYFGFDDIFSRRNAAPFWGGGITFDDDDIKYLLSVLPLGKLT